MVHAVQVMSRKYMITKIVPNAKIGESKLLQNNTNIAYRLIEGRSCLHNPSLRRLYILPRKVL